LFFGKFEIFKGPRDVGATPKNILYSVILYLMLLPIFGPHINVQKKTKYKKVERIKNIYIKGKNMKNVLVEEDQNT
jgi:hypothetical protein